MNSACRLCGGSVSPLFQKKQLRFTISYFECQNCKSMQTETPYWLEEAYSGLTFAKDTGMVSRTISCSRYVMALSLLEGFLSQDICLDFGGGTGLLTRLLRDAGLNAFWSDKYSDNIFSIGFEKPFPSAGPIKLITAFEVLEHLPSPLETFGEIFQQKPDYVFCSTKLYQGQNSEWWYLLDDGQHVQFYSKAGLHCIAKRFGYHLQTDSSTNHLFSKAPVHPRLLKRAMKKASSSRLERRCKKAFASKTETDHQHLLRSMP